MCPSNYRKFSIQAISFQSPCSYSLHHTISHKLKALVLLQGLNLINIKYFLVISRGICQRFSVTLHKDYINEMPHDESFFSFFDGSFLNHKFCIVQSETFTVCYMQMAGTKALGIETVLKCPHVMFVRLLNIYCAHSI